MKYLLTTIAITLLSVSVGHSQTASEKPNIILILTDDLGYGDLGYTGSTQIKTPNIDQLAKDGIVFPQAYVSAPVCGPSRAGLITGRYQGRFGFESNPHGHSWHNSDAIGLPLEEKTIGDRMQSLGYHTAAIGKWHLGHADHFYPTERGFDYFFGMRGGGHSYFPQFEQRTKPGYWYPQFTLERMGKKLDEIEVPYLTDWFTDDAMKYVEDRSKEANPWFLYLAYNAPHGPLEAKEEDIAKYKHVEHAGRRTYCAMVDCLDQNIGRLIEKLKTTGQYENTVIIFLNDNGGSTDTVYALNAPYWGSKGTYYEGGVRVPMFIHNAKRFKAGTYNKSVTALDLVPTCIALADGELPQRKMKQGRREKVILDGHNLLPFLSGEKGNARPYQETIFWRMMPRGTAALDGDWKLIQTPHSPNQLFNIAKDPSEQNNIIDQHPEIHAKLLNSMQTWATSHERPPMWMDMPAWGDTRSLHRRKHKLEQPK